jgi:hypothetical protein
MPAKKPTIWLLDEYKLGRDSWWFQLGVPKTLNFSKYFFLQSKENNTEAEGKEYDNMLNEMLQVIRAYDKREILPQNILPQAMYADFKEMYAKFPKENLLNMPSFFRISDMYIVITEQLAELLGDFRLGTTQISPIKLYEKSTGELLSEQIFILSMSAKNTAICFLKKVMLLWSLCLEEITAYIHIQAERTGRSYTVFLNRH